MSAVAASKAGGEKVVVSLDALMAQLNDLRNYISALQAQIDNLIAELTEVKSSENVVSELKTKAPEEVLAPADRRGHVMLRAKPVTIDSVVVHIGGDNYTELPLEKAIEIVLSKEKELSNVLTQLRKELNKATDYHDQLQLLVNSLIAQAKKQAKSEAK